MDVQPYTITHRAACLSIFDSNTPHFFDSSEREEFATFLDGMACPYVVVVNTDGEVVGCGGYYRDEARNRTGLAWGMVARPWHRQGVGRILMDHRLAALKEMGATTVTVRTSQYSRGFFERCGFRVVRVEPTGFTPEIDLVELVFNL